MSESRHDPLNRDASTSSVNSAPQSHDLKVQKNNVSVSAPAQMPVQNDQQPAAQPPLFTKAFVCIALANFAVFFSFQITTIGMPVYLQQLGANELMVGLTVTLVTAAALLIRPFAGLILDTFGRKGVLISGILIMVVATVAYVTFPYVGVVLVLRIIHGLGWGLGSTSTSTVVADILPKSRFAEGMGWYALGAALSAAVGPALSIFLLESVSAHAMVLVAAISLAIALVLSIFLEDTSAQASKASIDQTPESNGQVPQSAKKHRRQALTFDSLVEVKAWLPSLGILLVNVGFASVTAFIAVYGMAQGVKNISLYFVVYSIVTIISRPIIGRMVDKHGYFVPSFVGTLGVAATLLIISNSNTIIMFCIAGAFAGIGMGTASGVFQTMAVSTVPPQRKGVATSTYLIGLDGGLCIGSAVAGVIAGWLGYSLMYAVMTLFPLIAAVVFAICFKGWQHAHDES